MMISSILLQVVISCVFSSVTADVEQKNNNPQIAQCCFENDKGDEFLRQGTLISSEYITLNTNYIYGFNMTRVTCVLGAYNISEYEPSQVWVNVPPGNVIIHEKFEEPLTNNIALIKLPKPVKTNEYIRPATLPPKDYNNEDLVGMLVNAVSQGPTGTPLVLPVRIANRNIGRAITNNTLDNRYFLTLREKRYWSEHYFENIGNNTRVLIGQSLYSKPKNITMDNETRPMLVRISSRMDFHLDWIYSHTNIRDTP